MKIKLPLYFKFILGYLAFGLLGFATISTFSSSIMYGSAGILFRDDL